MKLTENQIEEAQMKSKNENKSVCDKWVALLTDKNYELIINKETGNAVHSDYYDSQFDAEDEINLFISNDTTTINRNQQYRTILTQVSNTGFLFPRKDGSNKPLPLFSEDPSIVESLT